jgi:RNA polymerase sigma factor (sigma-70 family)
VRDTPTPTERREAFRAIYEAHHAALCAYFARRTPRDEVEDLAAETFAVAWCKLPRKAGGSGGPAVFIEHPLPWLYAVAGNVLANHRRKVARRGSLAPDPATGDPAELVGGDRGLARAFAALNDRDREAICLVAWEGLSIADAARAAGCSAPAFHVRLSRARGRLSRALDNPPAATFIVPERI